MFNKKTLKFSEEQRRSNSNWNLFLTFNSNQEKVLFSKRKLFNKASNPWTLHLFKNLFRSCYFLFNKGISISFNFNNFNLGIKRGALCKFDVNITIWFFIRSSVVAEVLTDQNICKLVTSTTLHQIFVLIDVFEYIFCNCPNPFHCCFRSSTKRC